MWYYDEDYVSSGNTPYGVVGSEALSDNIISAEFTDDNNKLFDVNESINLNEGPGPDMVLNFQSRQY